MALIQWNETLLVNIQSIDHQHRRLVKMVNELDDAMRQGKGKEVLQIIINNLINYASTHFNTEENYFDRFGYPETGAHKNEHSDFAKRVSEFKKEFDRGNVRLSIQVMNFLCDWLQKHIKGSDKRYGPFLKGKGIL